MLTDNLEDAGVHTVTGQCWDGATVGQGNSGPVFSRTFTITRGDAGAVGMGVKGVPLNEP